MASKKNYLGTLDENNREPRPETKKKGEHHMLGFKFEIADNRRIARALAALDNTDEGRLLVGVKDNGAFAMVHSDEETFIIEAAAKMYCLPKVEYLSQSSTYFLIPS